MILFVVIFLAIGLGTFGLGLFLFIRTQIIMYTGKRLKATVISCEHNVQMDDDGMILKEGYTSTLRAKHEGETIKSTVDGAYVERNEVACRLYKGKIYPLAQLRRSSMAPPLLMLLGILIMYIITNPFSEALPQPLFESDYLYSIMLGFPK